jgi:hypothetical protein
MSRTNKPIELTRIEKPADRLSDPVTLGKIRNELLIYLFSRSEDPAGHQLEGVRLLIELS